MSVSWGRLTLTLSRVFDFDLKPIPAACGCKIWWLGPLIIEWEYKDGCGNVPYEEGGDDTN